MRQIKTSDMRTAVSFLLDLCKEDNGQDLVEYSLLLAFIALACVALLSSGSSSMVSIMSALNSDMSQANSFAN